MKPIQVFLLLLAGVVLGGLLLHILSPSTMGEAQPGLLDGNYLVVEGEDGHWIYQKQDDGSFRVITQEISPAGLKAIWELQGDYMPMSLKVGSEDILSVPATMYSTETRAFQVVHRFYRSVGDRLVEIPMDNLPINAPAAPPR